jgi:hypothetical protein
MLTLAQQEEQGCGRERVRPAASPSRALAFVILAVRTEGGVDGDAYVRSYRGPRGAWYRRALADGGAAISVDAQSIDVGVEQVGDEDVNRRVSGAFRAKYGARSPGPTETMVSPEVSRTTLRLTQNGSAP